ncbi:MAG: phospholipase D-like domain-containing protein, partial [Elusimicrobiota bacterium]
METETLTPPAEAPVYSPARNILRRGRTHWGEDPVEAAGLLADGRDYFRAFHEAASGAQNYILISGWQFDKDTALLRGADAADAQGEVRFLPFLDGLCRKNPRLRVYILAWNFNPILTLHREWMQEFVYNRVTCGQVKFRFDGGHAVWASQHQKFAVIDGRLAFLGGMDLCARRWDDRGHAADNPLRAENGVPYGPGHDVQAWAAGPAALRLSLFFRRRWRVSGGGRLELPPPSPRGPL